MAFNVQASKELTQVLNPLAQNFDKGLVLAVSSQKLSRTETLWTSFGWSGTNIGNLPQNHLSNVMFLKDGGILFAIRAYQQSLEKAVADFGRILEGNEKKLLEGIHLDQDGHPMILKESKWTRCDQIERDLAVDPETKVIYSKEDPDIHWSYTYPNGLVQDCDEEFHPCYKLSTGEITALKERSNTEQNHFFQVFTNGDTPTEQFDHTSCRLINAVTGEVYSFGLGRPDRQSVHSLFVKLAVFDTKIYSSPDFREFSRFTSRHVTTLPLEEAKYQTLVHKVEQYAKSAINFHFMRQNCTTLTADLLKTVGQKVEVTCYFTELISDLYPEGIGGIPYIGAVYIQIQGIVKPIFAYIHSIAPKQAVEAFDRLVVIILFIPNKMMTAIRNIFVIFLGGTTSAFPLRAANENNIQNQNRLTSFSRLMSLSIQDLFNDDLGKIASPIKVAQWQRTQNTTVSHPYAQGPMFNIIPPVA